MIKPALAAALPMPATSAKPWWREALQRERLLTLFAFTLALALLPTLIAMGLDDRQLRGVNVWAKPAKFMASIALFAITTAWFVGLLPEARRRARPVRVMVWMLLLTGGAEIAYITFQAALGQASHYNFTSRLHMLAYQVMGAGALLLTATQLVLAQQIARHGDPALPRVWREAVVLGLVMTFVLGVGAAAPTPSTKVITSPSTTASRQTRGSAGSPWRAICCASTSCVAVSSSAPAPITW